MPSISAFQDLREGITILPCSGERFMLVLVCYVTVIRYRRLGDSELEFISATKERRVSGVGPIRPSSTRADEPPYIHLTERLLQIYDVQNGEERPVTQSIDVRRALELAKVVDHIPADYDPSLPARIDASIGVDGEHRNRFCVHYRTTGRPDESEWYELKDSSDGPVITVVDPEDEKD